MSSSDDFGVPFWHTKSRVYIKDTFLWHKNHAYICDSTKNKCVHSFPWNKMQALKPSKLEWKFLPPLTSNFYILYLPESSTNSTDRVIELSTSHETDLE